MRDIPVGNGNLLVNLDDKYQIRDVYFPHVGQENHSEGFPFRFGVWADGEFSWVFSDDWTRSLKYVRDTLVTDVTLINEKLGITIRCNDTVAGRENIYLRRVEVSDDRGSDREIRLYLHHDFRIYENKVGDTAFYDPDSLSLIHYKKHRYFLINTSPHFDEFATGRKAFRNSEGTWRDAEDGHLYGGTITEGSVDSTIGIHHRLTPNGSFQFHYWIAAGTSRLEVAGLNDHVLTRGASNYFIEAEGFWSNWVREPQITDPDLPPDILDLYKRSLLIIRTQTDNGGAIIAANDHDVTDRATDHYSYLWPRDGAFVANALDLAGYPELSRKFFELCGNIVEERGYFLQKYNPDGTVGSGWHSHWDRHKKQRLVPIQEDETALVLWALGEHHRLHPNEALVRDVYERMIVRCADFIEGYRDPVTKLPKPSWNLWEDHLGIHTFTCATVVAGLRAAALFALQFADQERVDRYRIAADEIVAAMRDHLYSNELGHFMRALSAYDDGSLIPDDRLDASMFAIFYLGCFEADDPVVVNTMNAIRSRLLNDTPISGIMRFEHDGYMRGEDPAPPNSWIITTLWLADYYIAAAKETSDLEKALNILKWTVDRSLPSGVLAEQIDPLTGEARSVSPLTWSHSTFVATVNTYLLKKKSLEAAS
ncbi:MAG: glycoside hydrolase family 15 protein [Pyrinomonadaceae bacterium]